MSFVPKVNKLEGEIARNNRSYWQKQDSKSPNTQSNMAAYKMTEHK